MAVCLVVATMEATVNSVQISDKDCPSVAAMEAAVNAHKISDKVLVKSNSDYGAAGVETNASMDGEFSFHQWQLEASSSLSSVTRKIAQNIVPFQFLTVATAC